MSLLTDLRTELANTPAIAALVVAGGVTRIYEDDAAQGAARPFIVIEDGSGDPQHTLDPGPADFFLSDVAVTCHGADKDGRDALAELVRLALDGFRGQLGGVTEVRSCLLSDRHSDTLMDGDTKRPFTELVFDIHHVVSTS